MELVGNDHIDVLVATDATSDVSFTMGALSGMKIDLYQADITPARDTDLQTYLDGIADYSGYAQGDVTWGVPARADDGAIEVLGTTDVFKPNASTVGNNIFGLFTTLSDDSLGFAARFDNPPIPMGDTLDQITVTLRYRPTDGGLVAVIS